MKNENNIQTLFVGEKDKLEEKLQGANCSSNAMKKFAELMLKNGRGLPHIQYPQGNTLIHEYFAIKGTEIEEQARNMSDYLKVVEI